MLKPRLCGLATPRGNCYGRHVRDSQSFDRFAADYDRFATLEPPRVLQWLITKLPGHAGRALDAGCGPGRHMQVLAEHCDEVIGADNSTPLIDLARQRSIPNTRYVVSDLLTFSDARSFALVFSSTALHPVLDIEPALLPLRGLGGPGC